MEEIQTFLQVQGGGDRSGAHAELHHRERDVGLDADDDGVRAAQAGHLGDAAQRVETERVDDVQRGDVDDDAPGAVPADLVDQVVAGTASVCGVVQGSVDRRDQVRALSQDRDERRSGGPRQPFGTVRAG